MADISLVIDVIGDEKIEDAIRSTQAFEGRVKALDSALKRGSVGQKQFNQGLLEIKRAYKDAFGVSIQKASADIEKFKDSLNMSREVAETEKIKDAYLRLAASLDPVERATQEYQRSLKVLDAAKKQNIISETAHQRQLNILNGRLLQVKNTALQTAAAKRTLAASSGMAGVAMNQFGVQASRSQVKMKRFGSVGLQQVGYQVGDFAVQIQGGTNAMVALGQQGSQLLGIFGAGGALAGAGLAITTAFLAPLLRAKDAVEDFRVTADDAFGKYTSALSKAQKASDSLAKATKARIDYEIDNAGKIASNLRVEIGLRQQLADIEARRLRLEAEKLRISVQTRQETARELFESAAAEVSNPIELGNREFVNTGYAENLLRAFESVRKENAEFLLDLQEDVVQLELIDLLIKSTGDGLVNSANGADDLASSLDSVVERAEKYRDAIFEAQSFLFSRRFKNEAQVFEQEVSIKGGKLNPGMSYEELLALGVPPERLEEMGLKPKRSSKTGGGKSRKSDLEKLQETLDKQEALIFATETQRVLINALGADYEEYGETTIGVLSAQIERIRATNDEIDKWKDTIEAVQGPFEDFFNSLVDGTVSVEDAFKDMARSILQQLWDILVTQQIVNSALTALGSVGGPIGAAATALLNANGNAFNNGKLMAFADGGIVNRPTLFPMANGMGLMGEAGPEAVMPLKRGKDGKLGVSAEGGGTVIVQQTFNFSANGDESVRRIIAESAPTIAKLTERNILDSRRRGGAMKATFG